MAREGHDALGEEDLEVRVTDANERTFLAWTRTALGAFVLAAWVPS